MSSNGEGKVLSASEVSAHSSKDDLYLIIHGKVYDASSFIQEHPGGDDVLLEYAGQDVSEAFDDIGHSDEAGKIHEKLFIANLEGASEQMQGEAASAAPKPEDKPRAIDFSHLVLLAFLAAIVAWIYLG